MDGILKRHIRDCVNRPKVLVNRKYKEKADVFSFGIVVWEIFMGQCPYEGMTQIQVALGVLNNDFLPPFPRFIRKGSEGNATSNRRPLLFRCQTCKFHFGDNGYYERLIKHPHASSASPSGNRCQAFGRISLNVPIIIIFRFISRESRHIKLVL
ncbi:hypothetical protein PsorP6_015510 [Peronosclerospora sorghi]|uniref:Uncharacterized protein n=1 Tax=Peronosclerospora sorghi TaxID=230839 RepID=A0ACC0WPP6_9STRA|nr:hypothetical protein PsorP6_015510 [Peronosclerospora sorghi]